MARRNNNDWNNQNNERPPKHSGCRYTQGRNGKPVLTGWNKRKSHFMTFVATLNNPKNVARKDGSEIVNAKGQVYARWTATITDHTSMSESTVSCLYNTKTGKLYMPSFNLVANPKAPNGGYWGRCVSKNKR